MTVAEVAAELRVNPATVRRWITAGRLPAITLPGGSYRIERDDLGQLIAKSA